MKVVINKCFGGFGISIAALKELIVRNAKCVNSFTPKKYYGGESENYKSKEDWEKSWKIDFEDYEDLGDGFMAHRLGYNIYKDGLLYQLKDRGDNAVRTDSDLIEVIEKLGKDSFGEHSELKIVEIPDDVEWDIHDYDGSESIHEAHRVW